MPASTLIAVLLGGVLFGFGLSVSTMVKPEVVLSFLRFQDFGLLLVLGGAVVVAALTYQIVPRILGKPMLAREFSRHPSEMNAQTVRGAALFGIGWGLCGVCPGPAITGLGTGNWPLLIAIVGLFAGAYAHGWLASQSMERQRR